MEDPEDEKIKPAAPEAVEQARALQKQTEDIPAALATTREALEHLRAEANRLRKQAENLKPRLDPDKEPEA